MRFTSIAVVGVGLIGGSFAAAARRLPDPPTVVGIDADPRALAWATEHGIIESASLPDGLGAQTWLGPEGVDLVVLATPASHARSWIERLGSMGYRGVVTDVASTKAGIIEAAEESLGSQVAFVGGHPMTGSDRSGVAASDPELFRGAYYVLTPTATTDADAFRRVHSLVSEFGCRVVSVDAVAHDEAVAVVSHVPHVAASALVDVAARHAGPGGELLRLAAGGFKDTTRVAGASPALWAGICVDNAPAVLAGVRELRSVLTSFTALLEAGDREGLEGWFGRAAEIRRSLPAQWVPATERLIEVTVPVLDRPGVIAEVTTAAGRAGCNIEGIEIDHVSEASATLVMVLTDEGDVERFLGDLRQAGYAPQTRPLES